MARVRCRQINNTVLNKTNSPEKRCFSERRCGFHNGYSFDGKMKRWTSTRSFSSTSSSSSESSSSSPPQALPSESDEGNGVVVDDLPKDNTKETDSDETTTSATQASLKNAKKKPLRLPALSGTNNEFPSIESLSEQQRRRLLPPDNMEATSRKLRLSLNRVLEPPTMHLLAASGAATLMVGLVEGTIICKEWPLFFGGGDWDTTLFVLRYSIEQLFPSVVWMTQDPHLVALALGIEDPSQILYDLSGTTPDSASLLLKTKLLSSSRSFFAGFMMIAQLVRAATISIDAFAEYQERIKLGKEPPIVISDSRQRHNPNGGVVIRLCGVDSFVTEVSMMTMTPNHVFPIFEDPSQIQHLVWKYSQSLTRPIYWHIQPGSYASKYSWRLSAAEFENESSTLLPFAHRSYFFDGANSKDKILILEADATNGNDPLTLEVDKGVALDLTMDDASQGFRRILDQYDALGFVDGKDFRTLRVYLGNSMEIFTTGGGHSYTLRHRVKYAKEIDVLLDSRAPILQQILDWCQSVCCPDENEKKQIFFQTSSIKYFSNLKAILKEYGYEVLDPLDLRMFNKQRPTPEDDGITVAEPKGQSSSTSLMSILMDDQDQHGIFLEDYYSHLEGEINDRREEEGSSSGNCKHEMLRTVTRMSKLPRLVHMETTAATVNAVEALISAREISEEGGSKCCALIDRQDGVQALERTLHQTPNLIERHRYQWDTRTTTIDEEDMEVSSMSTTDNTSGLQIICSSSIHDNLFRQVRIWARMGYTASEIQNEIDSQYKIILNKSYYSIQRQGAVPVRCDTVQAGSGP